MDTVEVILTVPALDQDWLIGCLHGWATGFVQRDTELRAYIPSDRWSPSVREALNARLRAAGYEEALTANTVRDRNWNAVWEQSLDPVRVGPFLVCPTNASVPRHPSDPIPLRIDPKQSFGTGHDATTRLALRLLADTVSPDDRVLDVGTGTGILAIAACRLGAEAAVGVDTDPAAITNARENGPQNNVADCVTIRSGSVEVVSGAPFDVIVANITRGTILELLPEFHRLLSRNGTLILSGLLDGDGNQMREALSDQALSVQTEDTENGWWAARCSPQS